eukprot:scaffold75698_cov39-Prasinocladus_malaysianus.AAC.1
MPPLSLTPRRRLSSPATATAVQGGIDYCVLWVGAFHAGVVEAGPQDPPGCQVLGYTPRSFQLAAGQILGHLEHDWFDVLGINLAVVNHHLVDESVKRVGLLSACHANAEAAASAVWKRKALFLYKARCLIVLIVKAVHDRVVGCSGEGAFHFLGVIQALGQSVKFFPLAIVPHVHQCGASGAAGLHLLTYATISTLVPTSMPTSNVSGCRGSWPTSFMSSCSSPSTYRLARRSSPTVANTWCHMYCSNLHLV